MIALTGARGFIGSAIAAHAPCRVLTGDTRAVTASDLRGVDVLVHTAFKSVDTDASGFQANIDGTVALIAAAREAGVRRFLQTSTAGVYGHEPHTLADEDTPLAPDTPLSQSRAACDALLLESGLDAVILRTRFVLGPGDAAVVPRIHRAVTRSPVWLDGGRAQISVVGVADVARLVHTLAALPHLPPRVLHVTDGEPVSFRTLATELVALFGGKTPSLSVPFPLLHRPVRWYERLRGIDPETSSSSLSSIRLELAAQDQSFSNHRLMATLPDFRFTPRATVLANSADWYRDHLTASA